MNYFLNTLKVIVVQKVIAMNENRTGNFKLVSVANSHFEKS